MPSQKYSVVVFDLGNVLINFDYSIAVDKFNKIEPGLGQQFLAYHKNNYHIHREFEKGNISESEFVDFALKGVNHKVKPDTFAKIYSDIFTANNDVISLLPILKEKYKLVLLSNTDPLHKKFGWENYDFLSYFDQKVLSFEVGSVKPETKIYKTVEEFSKAKPEEHLYIDDIAEYAEAAKKLGWNAIQFMNYKQLLEEFSVRSVL